MNNYTLRVVLVALAVGLGFILGSGIVTALQGVLG